MRYLFPKFFLMAALSALSARATTILISGTFQSGSTLSDATFSGSFDIDFPVAPIYQQLSTFDVFVQNGGTTIEFSNNIPGALGQVFGQNEAADANTLPIQFFEPLGKTGYQFIRFYFPLPFDGNAAMLTSVDIPGNYTLYSSGIVEPDGTPFPGYTDLASGFATTAPEPGTCWLVSAGMLAAAGIRRRFKR